MWNYHHANATHDDTLSELDVQGTQIDASKHSARLTKNEFIMNISSSALLFIRILHKHNHFLHEYLTYIEFHDLYTHTADHMFFR